MYVKIVAVTDQTEITVGETTLTSPENMWFDTLRLAAEEWEAEARERSAQALNCLLWEQNQPMALAARLRASVRRITRPLALAVAAAALVGSAGTFMAVDALREYRGTPSAVLVADRVVERVGLNIVGGCEQC